MTTTQAGRLADLPARGRWNGVLVHLERKRRTRTKIPCYSLFLSTRARPESPKSLAPSCSNARALQPAFSKSLIFSLLPGNWCKATERPLPRASHGGGILLPIIQLRAHACQSQPRNAIRTAAAQLDQSTPFETPEKIERAIREAVAIAAEAVDRDDAVVSPRMSDKAALREHVQHALFKLGDVHFQRLRR